MSAGPLKLELIPNAGHESRQMSML